MSNGPTQFFSRAETLPIIDCCHAKRALKGFSLIETHKCLLYGMEFGQNDFFFDNALHTFIEIFTASGNVTWVIH